MKKVMLTALAALTSFSMLCSAIADTTTQERKTSSVVQQKAKKKHKKGKKGHGKGHKKVESSTATPAAEPGSAPAAPATH